MRNAAQVLSPLARVRSSVTAAALQSLRLKGYTVVENAIDSEWVNALREDIDSLHERSGLHLNTTRLVVPRGGGKTTTHLLPKKGIWESELFDLRGSSVSALSALQSDHSLLSHLNDGNNLNIRFGMHTTKVQVNEGDGACFPLHLDTDPVVDSRIVTAILYLNDEDWDKDRDGGQLQLAPWPGHGVEIAPRRNRLVLFSSTDMVHRVLPCHRRRYCLTMWLWADHDWSAPAQSPSRQEDRSARVGIGATDETEASTDKDAARRAAAMAVLMQPDYRRHAVRWALAAKWGLSLTEAHPPGSSTAQLLFTFWSEISMIERALIQAVSIAIAHQEESASVADEAAARVLREIRDTRSIGRVEECIDWFPSLG